MEQTLCKSHRPLKIIWKGKEPLEIKSVTMIDPVTRWFKITETLI